MAKIILNNEEFDFNGYNRNTYFHDDSISSTAYISDLRSIDLANRLKTLSQTTITSLQITVNNEVIYNLADIDAKMTSMDEAFNGVDTINTNVNLQFN